MGRPRVHARLIVSCETCSAEFETTTARRGDGRGRYCSMPCARVGQAKVRNAGKEPSRYHYVRLPGHPLAGVDDRVSTHRRVLYDTIGPGPHACRWCGRVVEWRKDGLTPGALVPDHLDGDGRNNDPSNLVPSCQPCNMRRGRSDQIQPDDVDVIVWPSGQRARGVRRTCEHCSVVFLIAPAVLRKPGSGRFCSPACMWGRPGGSPRYPAHVSR